MKQVIRRVGIMAVVGIMLIATIPLSGCRRQLSNEEHIERISERVRARFFEGSEFWMEHGAVYTDFRVTILYNHLEEPTFFMVEFEPDGFFYGIIYRNRYYNNVGISSSFLESLWGRQHGWWLDGDRWSWGGGSI